MTTKSGESLTDEQRLQNAYLRKRTYKSGGLNVKDLKAMCVKRELSEDGKRAELIARLIEASAGTSSGHNYNKKEEKSAKNGASAFPELPCPQQYLHRAKSWLQAANTRQAFERSMHETDRIQHERIKDKVTHLEERKQMLATDDENGRANLEERKRRIIIEGVVDPSHSDREAPKASTLPRLMSAVQCAQEVSRMDPSLRRSRSLEAYLNMMGKNSSARSEFGKSMKKEYVATFKTSPDIKHSVDPKAPFSTYFAYDADCPEVIGIFIKYLKDKFYRSRE